MGVIVAFFGIGNALIPMALMIYMVRKIRQSISIASMQKVFGPAVFTNYSHQAYWWPLIAMTKDFCLPLAGILFETPCPQGGREGGKANKILIIATCQLRHQVSSLRRLQLALCSPFAGRCRQ